MNPIFARMALGAMSLVAGVALCSCATVPPPGPSFMVLPAKGESFAVFQQHDTTCRAYAASTSGQIGSDTARSNKLASAAVGAGVGAAAGALLGSVGGHAGNGAAIGAGSGLLLGSVLGGERQRRSEGAVQHRYDMSYAECMAANGETLPRPAPPRPAIVYAPPVIYGPPPVVAYPAYPPS